MVKESILFVASTALLIYFVTPAEEPAETEAVAEKTEKPVTTSTADQDDGWGYDDSAGEDEAFVFGEPLTHSDDNYGNDDADDQQEESADAAKPTEAAPVRAAPVTTKGRQISSSSPGPNEPGGVNNPVILKTRTPANPVDD